LLCADFSSTIIPQIGSFAIYYFHLLFGLNRFKVKELLTTLTELIAIAMAAKIGLSNPVAAIGIKAVL
tara:strand:+ start:467 stop:670 length:204 start_codon:yes stop_codon:yes gene_type:complete